MCPHLILNLESLGQPRVIYNYHAVKVVFLLFFSITNLAIQTFSCIFVMIGTRGDNFSDPIGCLSLLRACFCHRIMLSLTILALDKKEIRQLSYTVCFSRGMQESMVAIRISWKNKCRSFWRSVFPHLPLLPKRELNLINWQTEEGT